MKPIENAKRTKTAIRRETMNTRHSPVRELGRYAIVGSLAAAALFACGVARAASVPSKVNYQGRLTDNSPQQLPINGSANMSFSIWDQSVAGSQLWREPAAGTYAVNVTSGIFNVVLGDNGVPLPPSVFA